MASVARSCAAALVLVCMVAAFATMAPEAAAAPVMKFPWDQAENSWRLTQGPHPAAGSTTPSGLDFSKGTNESHKVLAMFAGKVVYAGLSAPFQCPVNGQTVQNPQVGILALDGSKWQVDYIHLASIAVAKDQEVKQGQLLGYTSAQGCATGSHVHVELFINGQRTSWYDKTIDGWTVTADSVRGTPKRPRPGPS